MSCGVVKDNQLLPGIIRNVFSDNIGLDKILSSN